MDTKDALDAVIEELDEVVETAEEVKDKVEGVTEETAGTETPDEEVKDEAETSEVTEEKEEPETPETEEKNESVVILKEVAGLKQQVADAYDIIKEYDKMIKDIKAEVAELFFNGEVGTKSKDENEDEADYLDLY